MSSPFHKKQSILLAILLIILIWGMLAISIHQIFQDQMIGIDYMFYWHAGRVLIEEHGDIYSPEVGAQNQLWIYGRPALPGEDDLNFAYPLYILFLPLPFLFLRYDWSQAFWMATNLIVVITIGMFFFPKAPKWIALTFLFFYPIYFTLIIGNTALLIGLFFIIAFDYLFFKKEYSPKIEFVLGILMAFTTGKPQMIWLFLILILYKCLVSKRWYLIYGFGITFLFMNIISFALYPSWPINWIQNTLNYSKEGGIAPALIWYLSAFLPELAAFKVYLALFLITLPVTAYLFWKWKNSKIDSLCLITYAAFITNLFDPSSLTPDKISLLIPIFLWANYHPSLKSVKVTWIFGILLTNIAFIIGQVTQYKLAVDMLPLLFFLPWMIYIMVTRQNNHRFLNLSKEIA